MIRSLTTFLCLIFLLFSAAAFAAQNILNPIYIGASVGYGSTDWSMLVSDPTSPASQTTPISAKDTGVVWGFFTGYQFGPHFALEFRFMHFPKSTVTIRGFSSYWPFNPNPTTFNSKTYALALIAKFIIGVKWIPKLSAFADGGLGYVARKDILADKGRVGASFGLGFIYKLIQHVSAQLAFQYYTGYGRSEFLPAFDYIPFLYQVQFALAYHFRL